MQFEIGKFYKNRKGSKALYVGVGLIDLPLFIHYQNVKVGEMRTHNPDGSYYQDGATNLDIIGEWTEPMTGTVWVNVYSDIYYCAHQSKEEADSAVSGYKRIARKKITWTEGEFDE